MNTFDWPEFLQKFSEILLANDAASFEECGVHQIPDEYHRRGYLGYPGATVAQIIAAETRLGTDFPPSYRAFLSVSNGWGAMGITYPGKLWSTEETEWLRTRNQEEIDDWGNSEGDEISPVEHLLTRGTTWYRKSYLQSCLEISDWGDASRLLLCPEVVSSNGEWECWHLASWTPGVRRYQSFQEYMEYAGEREYNKP